MYDTSLVAYPKTTYATNGGTIMAKDKDSVCCNHHRTSGASGAVYGLGLVGAVIYFLQRAPTFWLGVLGFLKALVWPAFIVFEALKFFHL